MTEETRAELRMAIEAAVRFAMSGHRVGVESREPYRGYGYQKIQLWVEKYCFDDRDTAKAELTPAQHLALSVLLGDPAVTIGEAVKFGGVHVMRIRR